MKEFILTVGTAELYQDDVLVLTSDTETSNTITQSVNTQEIRAGELAQLVFEYSLEKTLEATLNDARWIPEFVAFNNGSTFINELVDSYVSEIVTLTADAGTVTGGTPEGDLFVVRASGSIQTVSPSGNNFTVTGAGDEVVNVKYRTNKSVDRLQIEADKYAGTFKLLIRNKIFSDEKGQGSPVGELITVIPQWKVTGNMEMTFDMSTPLTSTMAGKALAYKDPTNGKNIYAELIIDKTLDAQYADIVNLFAIPDSVGLDLSEGEDQQITTIGIRGNGQTNIQNPEGVTFTSDDELVATVTAGGLIESVGIGVCTITCELVVGTSTYTDTIDVEVIA
jgi:hypothetical protein